jgi:hypothetical protein
MAGNGPRAGYAPVNGLQMYYEIHGPATRWAAPLPACQRGHASAVNSHGLTAHQRVQGAPVVGSE